MGESLPGGFFILLKKAAKGFVKDKVLKLSAALAYYTVFSLGPMLIVIIFLVDLFWGRQAVEGSIHNQLNGLVGDNAAAQIQQIIQNASLSGSNTVAAIIGFITLLVGATTVFSEIQDSINTIWKIKVKPKKSLLRMVITRLLSFSLVVGLGFLLLVSLVANTLVEGLMNNLKREFSDVAVIVFYILNLLLTLLVVWFLFAAIFRVLPDAIIRWRDVAVGALFTSILFMLGKFAITVYISRSDIDSTYGAAGSLVILLVWVYFSSAILYFGAEFTKHYAIKYGSEIRPNDYAIMVHVVQLESKKATVQDNEKEAELLETGLQKVKEDAEGTLK